MDHLLEEALTAWHDSPATLPPIGRSFTADEHTERESQLDRFVDTIQREIHRPPRNRAERQSVHARLTAAFADFARAALALEDRHLELLLGPGGLSDVGTDLARQARSVDPDVAATDIFQACRNAWTACGIQRLHGGGLRLTPAIFAYSMLYPYTDNYLDDPATAGDAKRGFNHRFRERLAGGHPQPANQRESFIWRFVELIESQYPRAGYPEVFDSLLRIQSAQQASVRLLCSSAAPQRTEMLRVIFEKGGTSVEADGYLATGRLTVQQSRFVYNWGVFLQLADDLQDVPVDRRTGARTLFSEAAGHEPLDNLTTRTLHFGNRVMRLIDDLPADCLELKELIEASCLSLVIRSAGEVGELYTPSYLAELEQHSAFRFGFLNDRRKRLEQRGGLFIRLFEAFLAGDEDEPAFPWLPNSLLPRF